MNEPHLNDTLNRDFCTFLLVVVMMIKDTTHGPTFFSIFLNRRRRRRLTRAITLNEKESQMGGFLFLPSGCTLHSTFNNSNKIEGFQVKWRCFLKWRFFGGRSRKTTRQRHTHTQAGQRPILLRVCVCVQKKRKNQNDLDCMCIWLSRWMYLAAVVDVDGSALCNVNMQSQLATGFFQFVIDTVGIGWRKRRK